jgi:hypothetical protein
MACAVEFGNFAQKFSRTRKDRKHLVGVLFWWYWPSVQIKEGVVSRTVDLAPAFIITITMN